MLILSVICYSINMVLHIKIFYDVNSYIPLMTWLLEHDLTTNLASMCLYLD